MAKVLLICASVLAGIILAGMILIALLPENGAYKYPVAADGLMLLKHSVSMEVSDDKIWKFLENLGTNYAAWHPQDHRFFRWKSGVPLAAGSEFESEQVMSGEVVEYKGSVLESAVNRKIILGFSFPVSMISPKIEWIIDGDGDRSTFTAVTHMKLTKFFRLFFRSQIEKLIEDHDKHVTAEAENLKRILETQQKETHDE